MSIPKGIPATDIIGYADDQASEIYCTKCAIDDNDNIPESCHPILAGDEDADDEHCSACGKKLLGDD
jgi:hypothetical protein